jgi:uncharacterized protein YdeI (BOF family)
MNANPLAPFEYLQHCLEQKTREVAQTRNDAGYLGIWPAAVRELLEKYPNLTTEQKLTLRGNITEQIDALCRRTGQDIHQFTTAQQEVARLLMS